MLARVSTRRYRRTQEPVGERIATRAPSTSKSSVSRSLVARTREGARRADGARVRRSAPSGDDARRLGARKANDDLIVVLGITTGGAKTSLGFWEASAENATIATAQLSDFVERRLDPEQRILFVLDDSQRAAQGCALRVREAPVVTV